MSVNINYKYTKTTQNLILFVDEKFNISSLRKYFKLNEFNQLSDLIKSKNLKKKILIFELNSKKKYF